MFMINTKPKICWSKVKVKAHVQVQVWVQFQVWTLVQVSGQVDIEDQVKVMIFNCTLWCLYS